MPVDIERLIRERNTARKRREFIKLGIAAAGTLVIGGVAVKETFDWLERELQFKDPYRNIFLDGFLRGFVAIDKFPAESDLTGINLRTAPTLDPSTLRANSPEAFIQGKVPPGFIEVQSLASTQTGENAILGDLVEINGTSVVMDKYDPVTRRKSDLITPVIIQNPGLVKGQETKPDNKSDLWMVLNTLIRVPEKSYTEQSDTVYYTVISKTFYVNLEEQKLTDKAGNPAPDLGSLLVPLSILQDGSHIQTDDNQRPRFLGRVLF